LTLGNSNPCAAWAFISPNAKILRNCKKLNEQLKLLGKALSNNAESFFHAYGIHIRNTGEISAQNGNNARRMRIKLLKANGEDGSTVLPSSPPSPQAGTTNLDDMLRSVKDFHIK